MKNILIITNTRDNLTCDTSFIKDIDDIKDLPTKEMITNCINGKEYQNGDKWSNNQGVCGCERGGYIFSNFDMPNLPLQIEHIVNYVF